MATYRLLLLLALCVLPVLVNGANNRPFHIHGKVYCDTCRAGFETTKTYYMEGARVRIECRDRNSLQLKYSVDAVTDSKGAYEIKVENDHADDMCLSVLVSSPVRNCRAPDPGRSRATLILTRSNGAISDHHFANAMGFLQDKPLAGCAELLRKYLQDDDE